MNEEINIKHFLDIKFEELEKRLDMRDELNDKALTKAETTLSLRLESMNEFREQLKTQAATFITREEINSLQRVTDEKINYLTKILYIGIGVLTALQMILRFLK